jgi:hypothetical protein
VFSVCPIGVHPALNLSRPPKKNAWTKRSVFPTKSERKIEEAEVTAAGSQDNLRMEMTRIEAMQTEMTTLLSVNTEQMNRVVKMQETQTKAMNDLVTCVNQMMVRLAVIETLQAVSAEVREPQRNTAMENCDEELKTPPKPRTASKRTLSPAKESQEKKRSATESSPMRSKRRFDPPQGHLYEMKDHYETSEHEDYAAEKDEIVFEDGTDMKDDGSETWPSELQQTVDEVENESKEKTEATKKAPTGMFESVRHSLFPDRTATGGGRTSGRGGRGGGRSNGRN